MSINRLFGTATLCACLVGLAHAAAADDYPNRTIRMIQPGGVGSAIDLQARVVGEKFKDRTGQTFEVESRSGGNGMIGFDTVLHAKPDGYTLLSTSSAFSAGQVLQKSFTVDIPNDFEPIIEAVKFSTYIVANKNAPFKTLQDMVAYGKANPGKITMGYTSSLELDANIFMKSLGIEAAMISYPGTAPTIPALLGGSLDITLSSLATMKGLIADGSVRGLAVWAPKRAAVTPDIPAVGEIFPQMTVIQVHNGFSAPKGTPKDILAKLNAELNAILKMPDVSEKLAMALNAEVIGGTAESWKASQVDVLDQYKKAAAAMNIKPQ